MMFGWIICGSKVDGASCAVHAEYDEELAATAATAVKVIEVLPSLHVKGNSDLPLPFIEKLE